MLTFKQSLLITAAVAGVLGATTVAALADGEGAQPPGDGVVQVATIEPDARDAMSVLDTGRTSTDALPPEHAENLDANAPFGANPDLSRVSVGNASHSVYVVPADEHVCAALTVGGGFNLNCPETDAVSAGLAGPATVTLEQGSIAIYGLVPDGVEFVELATGQSDVSRAPVSDNAYYVVVPQGTELGSVSYVGPSGTVEFPIYDPALAFDGPAE